MKSQSNEATQAAKAEIVSGVPTANASSASAASPPSSTAQPPKADASVLSSPQPSPRPSPLVSPRPSLLQPSPVLARPSPTPAAPSSAAERAQTGRLRLEAPAPAPVDTVDTGAPATRSDLELLHDAEKLAEYRLGLTHDRVTR